VKELGFWKACCAVFSRETTVLGRIDFVLCMAALVAFEWLALAFGVTRTAIQTAMALPAVGAA